MARSIAEIQADIERTQMRLAQVKREIAVCEKLLTRLETISNDVLNCVSNLSSVISSLEFGITDKGVPIGGEQIEIRKNNLSNFEQITQQAIAKVKARLQELEGEKVRLEYKLVKLAEELAAAIEEARAAAEAAAQWWRKK